MQRIDELNRRWVQEEVHKVSEPESVSRSAAKESSAQSSSLFRDLLSLCMRVGSIMLAFMILFTFLYGLVRYSEPSMAPSIKDGDLVLFYRYSGAGYLPQDVIVLKYGEQKQVRRVIATAGDTVDITEEGLVINGALQQEPEIYRKAERYRDGVSFPLTVPEGQVFVLGDCRAGATDSRIYGCVKIEDTLGKVMTVIRRRSI